MLPLILEIESAIATAMLSLAAASLSYSGVARPVVQQRSAVARMGVSDLVGASEEISGKVWDPLNLSEKMDEGNLNLVRALARLKAVYFVVVAAATANQGTTFVGRANKDQVDTRTDAMNFHLQVGSQRFPDQPATGVAEHYYMLMQALGLDLDHDSISLDPGRYSVDNAVYAINLERASNQAAFSGISTMQGKTLTLTVNAAFSGNGVHNVYVFQVTDFLMNIRKGAVDRNE